VSRADGREREDLRGSRRVRGWLAAAVALGLLGVAPAAQPQDLETTGLFRLDAALGRPDLWSITTNSFGGVVHGGGFGWVDQDHTRARGGEAVPLCFRDQRVWETVVQFESGRVSRVDLSFYNRGDAGDLSAKAFAVLLERLTASLSNWTGVAAAPLPEVLGAARTKIQRVGWTKPPSRLELEWSVTKPQVLNGRQLAYRSEFIRLKLLPVAAVAAARTALPKPLLARTAITLRSHVQVATNGALIIRDVPMVDQGDKGYCAAAVMARVMGYYGMDFDMHQAAQVAGTESKGGTKGESLRDALKRIAQKNNLHFLAVHGLETYELQRLCTDYNHLAMVAHKAKVSIEQSDYKLDKLLDAMDGNLLRQARTKRTADLNKFKGDVAKYIDLGIPLIWDVYLGLVKEEFLLPQDRGGHLRLIIGYHKKTGAIYYTDTWGPRHECKQMPLGDAVTMTFGLYVIKPNSL
jgi:hypothetical protein